MSHVIKKLKFCRFRNKDAEQLCSIYTPDQHLSLRFAFFNDCLDWFVSDLVKNSEDCHGSFTEVGHERTVVDEIITTDTCPLKYNKPDSFPKFLVSAYVRTFLFLS